MPIEVLVKDEREQKTQPPLDPSQFNIQDVLSHADIQVPDEQVLKITVVLHNGAQEGEKRTPTSVLRHGYIDELYEAEFTDAKSGEKISIWQSRQVRDWNTWEIHVLVLPKDELSYAGTRAISRAVSREVFSISAFRAYGEMLSAIYPTPQAFLEAQKEFTDAAPWVLK